MKAIYLFLLFCAAGMTAQAVCPVGISAGGPVVFCFGDSVLLSATSGTGYTYQWQRNGVNIPGATAQQHVARTTGNYRVSVTVASPFCNALSNTISVTSEAPLNVFVTEPMTNMCQASTNLLEASPFGANYLYQWYEDGTLLPGLTQYQMESGHDGTYTCMVTNTCGTYSSGPYTMTYFANWMIPEIGYITPDGIVTICTGGSVVLQDNTSGGWGFGYQWYKDGTAIPGANGLSYSASQPGEYMLHLDYYCWINSSYREFWSNMVTVIQSGQPFPIASITAAGPTTFCAGSSVTLNAATNASWGYQWRRNNVDISGATSSSYNATTDGSYTCRVFSPCGSATSTAIVVTVIPTSVTVTPGGTRTICTGTTIQLSATSGGAGATYQWQLNGSNITGATSTTYLASSGNYNCVMTNSCGSFPSNSVTITQQPCALGLEFDGSNDYVRIPGNAAYAFGTGNFTIEAWVSLYNTGNTGAVLFSNYSSNGIFAQFSNTGLRVLLSGFEYNLAGPDMRDNLCHHVALTRNSTTLNYYVDGVLVGTVSTFSVHNATSNLSIILANHVFQNSAYALGGKMMEVRLWNTARTPTEIGSSMNSQLPGNDPGLVGYWRLDDGGGQVLNDLSITGNDGQLGSTTSTDVNDPVFRPACALSGCPLPSAVITAAGPVDLCPGGSVQLNINAGTGRTYQWKSNDIIIPGATGTAYTANTTGTYTCTVTDSCGSNTSNAIVVGTMPSTVTISTPGSLTLCTGSTLILSATSAGNGGTYQWKVNGTDIPGATSSSTVVSFAGNYTCSITNACGTYLSNTLSVAVVATCTTGLQFDGFNDRVTIPDSSIYNLGTGDFTVEAWIKAEVTQPSAYPIIFGKRLIDYSGFIVFLAGGQLSVQVDGNNLARVGPDLRDNICHHIAVTRSAGTVYQYIDGALISTQSGYGYDISTTHPLWIGDDEPNPNPFKGIIHEVRYWNYTRSQAQIQAMMDTLLAGNETGLIGYWRLNDGSGQSVHDYSTTAHDGFLGSNTFNDSSDPAFVTACQLSGCSMPAASITAGGSTTFCTGGSVTLNANTGSGLTYQWKLNTVDITGAVSSSYVATAAGTYTCVVTNACGSIASNSLVVTVVTPVTALITAGGSTNICAGGAVTLNANTGTGLSYQWKVNTVNISGATSSSYIASTAGSYTCVVTNVCGSNTSNALAVTVTSPPSAVITAGGSTSLCGGATVTLSANTGTGFTYQWKLNTVNITGATSSSYVASAAGSYTCVVTNICGNPTSNAIVVTVNTPPSAVITAGGNTNLCTGGSVTLSANTGTGLTYQWKLNAVNIPGATSSNYVASTAGSYNCEVMNACGNALSNFILVTVTGPPIAVITAGGPLTFCSGNFAPLGANTGTGLIYQWRRNGIDIGGATSQGYSAFTSGTYTCLVSNSCGGTISNSLVVTVLTIPAVPGTINGQVTGICGNTSVYSVNAVAGATIYNWTVPSGAVINSGQGTTSLSVTFPVPFSNGSISVTGGNTCGTSSASSRALFSTLLPAGTISGTASPCEMQRYVYSVPAVQGATNYTWIVPPKAKVMSGQGTPTVDVKFHKFGGTLSVSVSNACTTGTTSSRPLTIISCTGNPHLVALDATVYPNPSPDAFQLQVTSPGETSCMLSVMDMTGRLVERVENIAPGETISFGARLTAGVYLAEVIQGEERVVVRLVKSE